jgi:hypothetical protein
LGEGDFQVSPAMKDSAMSQTNSVDNQEPSAVAEAMEPEPKPTGLARFGQLASRFAASAPLGAAIGYGAHAAIVHVAGIGHPTLSAVAGCWIGWKAMRAQQNLGGAIMAWAGERTPEQEKAGPRASLWAVSRENKKTKNATFGMIGTAVKAGAGFAAMFTAMLVLEKITPKSAWRDELANKVGEGGFARMKASVKGQAARAVESLTRLGSMGNAWSAWQSANALLIMGRPKKAAELWAATRFNPNWPCQIELGERGKPAKRMPFHQALDAALEKRKTDIASQSSDLDDLVFDRANDLSQVEQVSDFARQLRAQREADALSEEIADSSAQKAKQAANECAQASPARPIAKPKARRV